VSGAHFTVRRCASTALLLVASVVTGRSAQAESAGEQKVELRVVACEPAFEAELRRILRLELGELLDEGTAGETREQQQLEVRCEPELARVSARDARRAQQADNDLRFDAFPTDAAPRAVALAAVEALRAVDPTLAARIEAQRTAAAAAKARAAPPLPTPSAEPVASPPVAAAHPAPARAWTRALLGAVVRHFASEPQTTVWGVRAELSRHASVPLDYGFDLEGAFSERGVELGAIDVRLFSVAAWIGGRAGRGDWSFTGGAGGRAGIANFEGSSPDPTVEASDASRLWAGPLAFARGDGAFGAFSLAIALEAGWAVAGAEGLSQGVPVVGAGGAWLALSLSPGIRF
jgi:hypothetical protein